MKSHLGFLLEVVEGFFMMDGEVQCESMCMVNEISELQIIL